MKYLLILVLMIAWGVTPGQISPCIACAPFGGVYYLNQQIQIGEVAARYVIFENVTADSMGVYMRDSFVLRSGEFEQLVVTNVNCDTVVSAPLVVSTDAILYNDISLAILRDMLSDATQMAQMACSGNENELGVRADLLEAKLNLVETWRAIIKANLSGNGLSVFLFNELQNLADISVIHTYIPLYKSFLSDPCDDIRLGGRLYFITDALGRLIYSHNQMQNIFEP